MMLVADGGRPEQGEKLGYIVDEMYHKIYHRTLTFQMRYTKMEKKKYYLINGKSNSPVVKTIEQNGVVFSIHENGYITSNYPSIFVSSLVKSKLDLTCINVSNYTFKFYSNNYYKAEEDGFKFNVGWINQNPDELYKASVALQLYRKDLLPLNKLKRYTVIHITNLYSSYRLNQMIKFVIIPIAKEFSDLNPLEDAYGNDLSPIWDDQHHYWDESPVDVYINKDYFRLVNNSYRCSKFIEWHLVDELPKATTKYSGIVVGNVNGKSIYQYDHSLTNVGETDNCITINGWSIKGNEDYASSNITKINYYGKPLVEPKTLEQSLYDGEKWLKSFCLPSSYKYSNKDLIDIFTYSISNEYTVLESCYETTYKILGAVKYLKSIGYSGTLRVLIKEPNTGLPDAYLEDLGFDTTTSVANELYQLGVTSKIITISGTYITHHHDGWDLVYHDVYDDYYDYVDIDIEPLGFVEIDVK